MKNKTTMIFGAIFVALVLIFMVTSYKPREESKGAVALFDGVKPIVDKIEIESAKKGKVVLEKKNSIWWITVPFEYKASNVTVEQTITGLLGIKQDGVISTLQETRGQVDVDETNGISLKVYSSGNIILDAIIGKYTVDLSHTYARMAGSDEIVLWRGLFSRQIDREPSDWRDKGIYSFNPEDIMSITITEGKTIRSIDLSDSTWIYTENGKRKEIDKDKVKKSVGLIASLKCDAFAD